MKHLKDWFLSDWLAVRVQIALGLIFIVAAFPKLLDPPALAKNIWAYGILPDGLVNLQALLMPGVEMVLGLVLVLGFFRRGAAILAAILLIIFAIALGYNLAIGHPVDCSCFEVNPVAKTCDELLAEMKWLIIRDVGLLLMAAHVIWVCHLRRREEAGLAS